MLYKVNTIEKCYHTIALGATIITNRRSAHYYLHYTPVCVYYKCFTRYTLTPLSNCLGIWGYKYDNTTKQNTQQEAVREEHNLCNYGRNINYPTANNLFKLHIVISQILDNQIVNCTLIFSQYNNNNKLTFF